MANAVILPFIFYCDCACYIIFTGDFIAAISGTHFHLKNLFPATNYLDVILQ
jgi:hypothetical protein